MTQHLYPDGLPGGDTPTDDTPLDERPPYGEPGAWFRKIATVALIVAAALVAVYVAFRVWRSVRARAARLVVGVVTVATVDPSTVRDREVIMIPADVPATGPVWRVHFFDDTYPQLTDRDIAVALYLDDPDADRKLAATAELLAAEVERRDGQRCFRPRVVLVDGAGRTVREWTR